MRTKAAIIGHVVDDLEYRPLSPDRYRVRLNGKPIRVFSKGGGYFAVPGLEPGSYRLEIGGPEYRTRYFEIELGRDNFYLWVSGENELLVAVQASEWIDARTLRASFAPVSLSEPIRARSEVYGRSFEGELIRPLGPGPVNRVSIRITAGSGEAGETVNPAGAFLRIVRDRSIELGYGPFVSYPKGVTVFAGRVSLLPSKAGLAGLGLELKAVNGEPIAWEEVGGVPLAHILGETGPVMLGTAGDLETRSDREGRFHFYFPRHVPVRELDLAIASTRYEPRTHRVAVQPGLRTFKELGLRRRAGPGIPDLGPDPGRGEQAFQTKTDEPH